MQPAARPTAVCLGGAADVGVASRRWFSRSRNLPAAATSTLTVRDTHPLSPPVSFTAKDQRAVFAGFPTHKLIRAWVVFTICGIPPLVRNAEALLATARRVFGDGLVSAVVRPTFFAHFCAGEDEGSIRPTVDFLAANGIGAILDYAAEADVAEDTGPGAGVVDLGAGSSAGVPSNRKGVHSARVYDYVTEQECDANLEIFKAAIVAVRNVSPTGFAAIKITGLGNPLLLERWSTALLEIRHLFAALDANGDGRLTWAEFIGGCSRIFVVDPAMERTLRGLFDRFDVGGVGSIDALDWTTALEADGPIARHAARMCREEGRYSLAMLDDEEAVLVARTVARADELTALAAELGVKIMIDAEHSYFQPAIDNIVLGLQRKYNRGADARVYNTIQCYLKEAPAKLDEHILRSEREGWHFACKIVRGAYMVLERERAAAMGYPDPVHDTIEHTHACYNTAAATVMERAAVQDGRSSINLMVATHNKESIENIVARMDANAIDRKDGSVGFGQLLGMSDHLSFGLGAAGYCIYKYLPYGPENEVLPYLVRRAQENSSMLSGAGLERAMIQQELVRRWKAETEG